MGKESLSLIHSENSGKIVPIRKPRVIDFGSEPGFKLTGLTITRSGHDVFTFPDGRLIRAVLEPGLILQITSLDPDGIIRRQTFRCNHQDTVLGLRYASPGKETTITIEFDKNFHSKPSLLLVK